MAWRLMSQRAWHYGVDIRVELPRIIPQGIAEYEYYAILKNEQCASVAVDAAGIGMKVMASVTNTTCSCISGGYPAFGVT
jgi:hypothetical protein